MLSLRCFRQTKCSVFAVQRQMSLRTLPKCANQLNVVGRLGNTILSKPSISAPIIARFNSTTTTAKSDKNYATVWKTERIISIALMGLFPAAFVYPSQILDTLLAVGTGLHVYWGLEALVVDYLRVPVVGQLANKAGHIAISAIAIITIAGFLQVIFMGDGLANSVIQLWKL